MTNKKVCLFAALCPTPASPATVLVKGSVGKRGDGTGVGVGREDR